MISSQLDAVLRTAKSICFDSRLIEPGCAFVAIRGVKIDGHHFVVQAIQAGASALVVEDPLAVPGTFKGPVAVVESAREALGLLAARFYREPSRELFAIGVTGTNGKTTATHMIEAILNESGRLTGVIGTIDHHVGKHVWKTELTTPDPLAFQKRLREFVDLGASAVALEASSHALAQARIDEVQFDVAIFTNLSRDHLDYHHDMEVYFQSKHKLFINLLARSIKQRKVALVNGDDEYGRRIQAPQGTNLVRFGQGTNCDLQFQVTALSFAGSKFTLKLPQGLLLGQSPGPNDGQSSSEHDFEIRMPGLHNIENAVAAVGAALAAGVPPEICARALAKLSGVAGRLERVEIAKGVHVFVDFAHTDAALTGILQGIARLKKDVSPNARVITVFGCGGDRDKGKRPLMMQAAVAGSDFVILTSDNPRTEDPEAILRDALAGAPADLHVNKVIVEVDRRQAIFRALQIARVGDVVLIAGKGHENYQQIGTKKQPFSDVEVVKEFKA